MPGGVVNTRTAFDAQRRVVDRVWRERSLRPVPNQRRPGTYGYAMPDERLRDTAEEVLRSEYRPYIGGGGLAPMPRRLRAVPTAVYVGSDGQIRQLPSGSGACNLNLSTPHRHNGYWYSSRNMYRTWVEAATGEAMFSLSDHRSKNPCYFWEVGMDGLTRTDSWVSLGIMAKLEHFPAAFAMWNDPGRCPNQYIREEGQRFVEWTP